MTARSSRLRARWGESDAAGSARPVVGGGSDAPAPAGRPVWWDGVSNVVTRPAREHVTQPARSYLDPRARHLTGEHVTLADVLAG